MHRRAVADVCAGAGPRLRSWAGRTRASVRHRRGGPGGRGAWRRSSGVASGRDELGCGVAQCAAKRTETAGGVALDRADAAVKGCGRLLDGHVVVEAQDKTGTL